MAEQSIEVITSKINYLCDECGEPMIPGGVALLTAPPKYPHRCVNGHAITLGERYPAIRYSLP